MTIFLVSSLNVLICDKSLKTINGSAMLGLSAQRSDSLPSRWEHCGVGTTASAA